MPKVPWVNLGDISRHPGRKSIQSINPDWCAEAKQPVSDKQKKSQVRRKTVAAAGPEEEDDRQSRGVTSCTSMSGA